MSRERSSGTANVPTPAQVAEAAEAVEKALEDLRYAADSVLLRLSRISNPVERAKAAHEIRRATTGEMANATDNLYRAAIIEALATGRAEHGWYGYGALAEELGISRARVQQVVTGAWKKGEKDTAQIAALRASADNARRVNRLSAAGHPPEDIAEALDLSLAEVHDLIRHPLHNP